MIIKPRNDITAKVVAASVCAVTGRRIDTMQLRYPRIVHAEFMTHREFSRNAASSRAIPTTAILVRDEDMYVPLFRRNQPGMSPGAYLPVAEQTEAARIWKEAAEVCIAAAKQLSAKDGLNVHKQWANRMLEWFGYIDVLASSTNWLNWDCLRDHPAAQDEIRLLCQAMRDARESVKPRILHPGDWHLPYVSDEDIDRAWDEASNFKDQIDEIWKSIPQKHIPRPEKLLLIASAARCCRLSYSKHDGTPSTFAEDIVRFMKLVPENDPVHASPLEHQATPLAGWKHAFPAFDGRGDDLQGNFRDFAQFRKIIPREAVRAANP